MKGCDIMNNDFLVPTGRIIKEYLEEYGITQKDLAERINISKKHISNVLKGKSRVTEEFALKLEKVILDVPASYWLNYEATYREQVAREEEIVAISKWNLQEIAKRFHFKNDVIVSFADNDNVKEQEANEFARNFFINSEHYKEFCNQRDICADTIKQFARQEGTIPEIVVARLQHDKKIGFEQFNHLL